MSHYALAVFCNEPHEEAFRKLLVPYDENNEDFFVFEPVDQAVIGERWKKFHELNPKWTAKDYLKEMWHFDQKTGRFGYWSNPNALYDYYTIGGKDYLFETFEDANPGEFRKKSEVDWRIVDTDEPIPDKITKITRLIEEWEKFSVEGDGLFTPEYYLDRYVNRDYYIDEMLRPLTPYAFIAPDGKLHAPGKVGWFGTSSETVETSREYFREFAEFIAFEPDCYVTVCDCHI